MENSAPVFELSPRAIWRNVDGEAVVLELNKGTYYGLNEVATRAWNLMKDGMPEAQLIDCLEAEYDVRRGELEVDVKHLLRELLSRGLIVEHHEPL